MNLQNFSSDGVIRPPTAETRTRFVVEFQDRHQWYFDSLKRATLACKALKNHPPVKIFEVFETKIGYTYERIAEKELTL